MIIEPQTENFAMNNKRLKCDWQDNVIIPTIHEFNQASANITRLFNPKSKTINQKKAERILEEIYGK